MLKVLHASKEALFLRKYFTAGFQKPESHHLILYKAEISVLRHDVSERLAALWICRHVKQRGAGGPSRAVFTLITVAN